MPKVKKFVFVLMPFDSKFDDIYTFGIKQTCTELGIYCERVDEQIYKERILDRIYNQIAKADIIIADMSGRNSNVFYEVGYAHGIGKNVILLTQSTTDIPFDLQHHLHIVYEGQIKLLSEKLKPRVEWFLSEETAKEVVNHDFALEVIVNAVKIQPDTKLTLGNEEFGIMFSEYPVEISIHNASDKLHKSKVKIGLEVPVEYKPMFSGLQSIASSPGYALFVSKEFANVYPRAYHTIELKIKEEHVSRIDEEYDKVLTPVRIPAKIKVFTSLEMREIAFTILVPRRNFW